MSEFDSNDKRCLAALSGANFRPEAGVLLPSATQLNAEQAHTITGAFQPPSIDSPVNESPMMLLPQQESEYPEPPQIDNPNPLSSVHDSWTGNAADDRASLVARALAAPLPPPPEMPRKLQPRQPLKLPRFLLWFRR